MSSKNEEKTEVNAASAAAYVAPVIEEVISQEKLEREVQYAGSAVPSRGA